MAHAGLHPLFPLAELSVMWFLQVLLKAPTFLRLLKQVEGNFRANPPDLCVLIDYPGLNFCIAKKAKRHGIPVLYYISPQVWAWHRSRIKKMKRLIDHILVILPFEERLFQSAGIPVTYVGHPLFDNMARFEPDPAFRESLLQGSRGPLVALLPGSRRQEIRHILPLMLGAAKILKMRFPGIRFVVSPAEPSLVPQIERIAGDAGKDLAIPLKKNYDIMKAADLALTASGTATLELAHFGTPMIILYKTIPFSWLLCKILMKTDFIGMVNILGNREVVPEFFPLFGGAKKLAAKADEILSNPALRETITRNLREIRDQLALPGTSQTAAEKVLSFLKRRGQKGFKD